MSEPGRAGAGERGALGARGGEGEGRRREGGRRGGAAVWRSPRRLSCSTITIVGGGGEGELGAPRPCGCGGGGGEGFLSINPGVLGGVTGIVR